MRLRGICFILNNVIHEFLYETDRNEIYSTHGLLSMGRATTSAAVAAPTINKTESLSWTM